MEQFKGIGNKQWKVVFVSIFLAGLYPSLSLAAPAVTSASGSIKLGETVTISGSGFGAHPMQVESLQSNIEAGTNGSVLSKTGWVKDWGWANPLYATDAAHSGSKSLKCTVNGTNQYNCAFAYDMPNVTAGQRFYATWWVKYSGDTGGQWKMFRASGPLTIIDGAQETMVSNWFSSQKYAMINPGATGQNVLWMGGNQLPPGNNQWYRVELNFVAGSTNTSNGTISIRTTSDTGISEEANFPGVNTHISGSDKWDHAIWQNYIGNGINNATIWFDDLYVQYNTPARVELCSGSTWANRGKCEIQVPTSWGTTSISATANVGNFSSGATAYIYVVDSTGSANSNGTKVTIGASSSGTTPVTPPAPTLNLIKAQ